MKKNHITFLLLFFCLSSLGAPWVINKDHSEIFFKVSYLKVTHVTGRVEDFSGQVDFSSQKIEIHFNSKSLDTGNKLRDGHLKANDFLKSKKYPFITFTAEKILKLGKNLFEAHGELRIKDQARALKIRFEQTEALKDTWSHESRFIQFKTKINRSDFSLDWNKSVAGDSLLVGDEVLIWGKFQIQPKGSLTPSSNHMVPDTKQVRLREKTNRGELPQKTIQYESSLKIKTPKRKEKLPPRKEKLISKKKKYSYDKSFRDKASWRISYLIMGFIGFCATIIMAFQGKYLFIKLWPKEYEEGGHLGLLSDLAIYPVVIIYMISMWYLGYA
jgi:polyisoprenoid-binding protein YceI